MTLLLAACGTDGGTTGDDTPTTGAEPEIDGTFSMALEGDPGDLHPHLSVIVVQRNLVATMYDKLVYFTEEGEERPWLATSWDVQPDTVTFTVRDDVTCSDGTPLTPSDIAANFEFITDPENESPLRGVAVPADLEASADDAAGTVTVSVDEPNPFLFVSAAETLIACGAGLEDPKKLTDAGIGTGMYELTEAVPDDHYTFERRDDYAWGPDGMTAADPGTAKMIEVRIITEEQTAVNLFLSGELDTVSPIGPDRERLADQGYDGGSRRAVVGEMFFNQADGHPGADPEVRAALAQALDFTELMPVITGGYGEMSRSAAAIPPPVCLYNSVNGNLPKQDVDRAEAALDAAGWIEGSDGIREKDGEKLAVGLTHSSDSGAPTAAAAELIAKMLTEVGVDVESRGLPSTEYSEVLFATGAWDVALVPVNARMPTELVPFLSGAVPPDGVNFAHLDNQEYRAAVNEAMKLPGVESCQKWKEAEVALMRADDMFLFADGLIPVFNDGVTFSLGDTGIVPPTVRLWAE